MHIAMAVPGMPFNGETIPNGQSLGGSESAGYYMARELVKRGHKVIVFTNSEKGGTWDGVTYEYFGMHFQAPITASSMSGGCTIWRCTANRSRYRHSS